MKKMNLIKTAILFLVASLLFTLLALAATAACGDGMCDADECSYCTYDCPNGCTPPPVCNNNGVCEGLETCSNCPGDCGSCNTCDEDSCNDKDGWYDTGSKRWVSSGECKEKEQKEQKYRNYYCSASDVCTYSVTDTRWVDTGNTRNKPNGTSCNDGLFCTTSDVCTSGTCGGSARQCNDGLFCTVNDRCSESQDKCLYDPRDCSANNLPTIAKCNNNPDNMPFTWDYAPGFTSVCDESNNLCTSSTYTFTHTCDKARCGAECESDPDCNDFNPYTTDSCTDGCTCSNTPTGYCGDGSINQPGEECELPGTLNNAYCPQTTTTCSGAELGTRDAKGNCDLECGCTQDTFNYACVAGSCGATCSDGQTTTEPCGSDIGECKKGYFLLQCLPGICNYGEPAGECIGAIGPTEETCDGKDNDCDGEIDEGLVRSCGDSICAGTQRCIDAQWGSCDSEGYDAGKCAACDAFGNVIYDPTQNADCSNSLFCDGAERCSGIGQCTTGTPVTCADGLFCTVNERCDESLDRCVTAPRDCSGNNLPDLGTCDYVPDANPFTWDSALGGFISTCDEVHNECTTGTYEDISHECSTELCGAQCESDSDCIAGHTCAGCVCTCSASSEICDGKDNDCDGKIDEDNACGPRITSSPGTRFCIESTSPSANIYYYDVEAIDPDDTELSYLLMSSPLGMSINPSSGLISWPVDKEDVGTSQVIVRVEDRVFTPVDANCINVIMSPVCAKNGNSFRNICELEAAGQELWHEGYCYDTQSYNLEICKPDEEIYPRRKYALEQVDILNAEPVCAGDPLMVLLTITNNGLWDNKDVKVTFVVADLDIRRTIGPFRLDADETLTRRIDLDLPGYADEGMHDLQVYVYSNSGDIHRIKYREFWVKQCGEYSCERYNPICYPGEDC